MTHLSVIIPAIVAVLLSAPLSHAAPYSSPGPELTLPVELLSTGAPEPPTFHHDSSLYVALFHGAGPSPSTFTDDSDVEDTPAPGAIFPLQGPTDTVILSYPPSSETVEEHAPSQMTLPEGHRAALETHNPMEEEVLASQEDDGQSKIIARDISLASRSGKAIGRDFVSSSPIPQVAAVTPPPAHVSNHNPFLISDELPNKNEPADEVAKKSVVPVTAPSISSSEVADEKHDDKVQQAAIIKQDQDSNVSATSPKEQEVTASPMTSAPTLAETTDVSSEEMEVHSFEVISTATPAVLPSLLPPAWVPSFSSDEESVEEEEAEENARPNLSITEEQPTESDGSDVSRGASGFVWYRRRYLNKPQTLNDKCSNADSSGYIDDTLRVSAARMNTGAVGAPAGRARRGDRVAAADVREPRDTSTLTRNKDNSEEMYSLDNDSFLNSLEAMTIQNYWTDSVKHTKL
ncbi:hypothetical protein B566_EDAN006065 [Ephemera danica]|nr:hypothetical protein B566_EDAN006065 [Ephemera danica]